MSKVLNLKKNIVDIDGAGNGSIDHAGEQIQYSIHVSNDGTETLLNVVVNDPVTGLQDTIPSLAPGESKDYAVTYTVTQNDFDTNGTAENNPTFNDPGSIDNTATAKASGAFAAGSTSVEITQIHDFTVEKTADVSSVSNAGDVVNYEINVTNTGNTVLTGVSASDPLLGSLTLSGDADSDGKLDVGETWTYTGSHTVTQAEIDSNGVDSTGAPDNDDDIDNIVTVTTTEAGSKTDDAAVTIEHNYNFTVEKTADVSTVSNAGDVINYEINITNTGNTVLTGLDASDPLLGTLTLVSGDADSDGNLDVGETWTYTGSHTVTQAEIDSNGVDSTGTPDNDGDIDNTVTVTTNEAGPKSDDATVAIEHTYDFTVEKTADVTSVSNANDLINYTINITNTGNTMLTGLDVSDPLLGTLSLVTGDGDGDGNLDVGETWTFTGSHSVSQDEIDSNGVDYTGAPDNDGDIDNVVTVTTNEAGPKSDDATVAIEHIYNFTVEKTADVTSVSNAGDVINYEINITNTGNTVLTGVSASDPLLGALTLSGDTDGDGNLDVDETWTYTGSHTVTQAEIDSNGVDYTGAPDNDGDIDNTVTVTTNEAGSKSDDAAVTIEHTYDFTVEKTADVSTVSNAGDVINYEINVTNTGNTVLTGVSANDPLLGALTLSGDTDGDGNLDVGETWTYTGSHTVTQAEIDSNGVDYTGAPDDDGDIDNTVTVTTNEVGPKSDDATVVIDRNPDFTVEKTADVSSVSNAGDLINYEINITNTGNTVLTGVSASDPLLGALTLSGDTDGDGNLDVGETWTYTGSHTVTQAEIDSNGVDYTGAPDGDGDIDNTVTVTTNEVGPKSDDATVAIDRTPDFTVTKTSLEDTVGAAGDIIHYTITVDNTGNTSLTGVNVSDPLLGALTGPSGDDGDGILGVDETWTYTGTYTVQQSDIDDNGGGDGDIDNTVTVNTDQIGPKSADDSVDILAPSFTVDKSVTKVVCGSHGKVDSAGDIIRYKIVVENTGQSAIHDVVVNDPLLTNVYLASGDTNSNNVLDVGEKWIFKGSYTVKQSDINSNGIDSHGVGDGDCDIDNTVTVTTSNAGSEEDSASVGIKYKPDFYVVKTGYVEDGRADEVGDVIKYHIALKNTGNVDLTNVNITDYYAEPLQVIGDGNGDNILNVGETWTFSTQHVLTQAEIKKGGTYINVVTVQTDEAGDDSDYVVTKLYKQRQDCGCDSHDNTQPDYDVLSARHSPVDTFVGV